MDPYECESSCVDEIDKIYRDFTKSPSCDSYSNEYKEYTLEFRKTCEIFNKTGNPVCGKINYAEIYEKSKSVDTEFRGNQNNICSDTDCKS